MFLKYSTLLKISPALDETAGKMCLRVMCSECVGPAGGGQSPGAWPEGGCSSAADQKPAGSLWDPCRPPQLPLMWTDTPAYPSPPPSVWATTVICFNDSSFSHVWLESHIWLAVTLMELKILTLSWERGGVLVSLNSLRFYYCLLSIIVYLIRRTF